MTERRADIGFYLCEKVGDSWEIVGRYGSTQEAEAAAGRRHPGQSHWYWKHHSDMPGQFDTIRDGYGTAVIVDAFGIHRLRDKWGPESGGTHIIPDSSD